MNLIVSDFELVLYECNYYESGLLPPLINQLIPQPDSIFFKTLHVRYILGPTGADYFQQLWLNVLFNCLISLSLGS